MTDSDSRHFLPSSSRPFRSSLAATLVLSLLAFGPPALAEIINVKPNVADDIGNWTTTVVDEFQIRLNGFTGYEATGIAADEIVDKGGSRGKTSHAQHIVRLPNAVGPDGQWHAYFAITHSGDWGSSATVGGGDGYWLVAEIDADNFDPVNDRIITDSVATSSGTSEGKYVYEEHFTTDVFAVSPNCTPTPCLDGNIWYSDAGDWNHPAAMATMGDALLMVGQQYPATIPVYGDTLALGDSADALLFYDVSEPWAPKYVGKLDVCELGVVDVSVSCGSVTTNPASQDVLSTLGLAYFDNGENGGNGWYHLSVGNGDDKNNNFYCDSGADCFKAPLTVGTADSKWKDLDASVSEGKEANAGGQNGQIIISREIYSSNPAPGEPCYKSDGTLLGSLGADEENTICSPPGVQRAMRVYATAGAYLSKLPWETGGFQLYVQGKCWPWEYCTSDEWWSYDLSDYSSDQGIPIFRSLGYKKRKGFGENSAGGSVFSLGPDADFYDSSGDIYRRRSGSPADYTMTQLTGECKANNGAHVNDNGEVIIYCVSESINEPIDCPDGGECNRIFSQRANGAPSYGVIRFTEPGGRQLTFRGRGLTDTEILNQPPWGPGRNEDGSLKDPQAVDWKQALITPGTTFQVLSGEWLTYEQERFDAPVEGFFARPQFVAYRYRIGTQSGTDVISHPPFRSLRVMPQQGIALFAKNDLRGRMVSAVESVPNLVRYCGDDWKACNDLKPTGPEVDNDGSRAMDGECKFKPRLNGGWFTCTYPRTIWQNVLGAKIKNSAWQIFGDLNYNEAWPGTTWNGTDRSEYSSAGGQSIKKLPAGNCVAPPKATAISDTPTYPLGDGRPMLEWERLPGGGDVNKANLYNVQFERLDGAIIVDDYLSDPVPRFIDGTIVGYTETTKKWMARPEQLEGTNVGETYRWRVRGIDAQDNCYEEGPWSDYNFVTLLGSSVTVSLTPVTNDPLGLGTGTIEFAPGSAAPSSDVGSNYYASGSVVILLATAAPDSEFVSWAGDAASCGTATTCQITVSANLNLQAVFRPKPRLLRSPQGAGTVTVNPSGIECSNSNGWDCDIYATGTVVDMTAAAEPGQSNFLKWAGDADCSDDDDADGNPLTSRVTMSEKKACTAIFTRSSYLLEATTATSGGAVSVSDSSGAVTCDPQGQICTKSYAAGIEQTATLTATADNGFRFVRWNGSDECWSPANGNGGNSSIDITVGTTDMYCRAVFVDLNGVFTLNVQKTGAGSGASTVKAVVTNPAPANLPEISCALPACTTEVPSTATIQLTAIPVRGARFDGWYGSDPLCELPPIQVPDPDNPPFTIDSPDPNPVITVDMADVAASGGDLSCRANFSAKILLVDGSADGSSSGPRVDYESVFNTLPDVDIDTWSVRSPNSTGNPDGRAEPTAADLAPYSRVVWFTADASAGGDPNSGPIPAGPSPAAEATLGEFLDGGGCLMLSSAEYVADRGLTSFAQSYLGINSVAQNIGTATSVNGTGLLPGFNGMGPFTLDYGTASGASLNAALSDAVIADGNPDTYALLQYGDETTAGVGRDNGTYRTAFLGFPFLALPSGAARSEVMGTFLGYCLQIEKDDEFEANDDGEAGNIRSDIDDQRATRLQGDVFLTDLKILPGNDDWYRWETTVETDTKFEILFSHDSGDLNFDFYEGNRRDPSDFIQSTDDNEIREFFTFPGQAFFMRVYGVDGASNSYTLKITSEYIDTDGDGLSNVIDLDDDGDGMSDEFEIANNLDPLLADDANFDEDDDGYTNLEEALGGSDLRNPGSVPTPPSTPASFAYFNLPISCSPSLPTIVCSPVSLPWLNLLLDDGN